MNKNKRIEQERHEDENEDITHGKPKTILGC